MIEPAVNQWRAFNQKVPRVVVAPEAQVLTVYPRKAWTSSTKNNLTPMNGVKMITVHHTAHSAASLHNRSETAMLNSIYRNHTKTRGWSDIGYHYLIATNGNIYVGRESRYVGAHSAGKNSHNIGIALIGNFEAQSPARQQILSLKKLLESLRKSHKIPKSQIFGHRNHKSTLCPGEHLYKWLVDYREGKDD